MVRLIGLITLLVILGIGILGASFWCNIDPTENYTWFSGWWHGVCVLPNYVLSLFTGDTLIKAENYTTAYNVFWWMFTASSLITFTKIIVNIILPPKS